MDQRMRFVADVLKGEESLAAICRRYGVSRQAGHKTIDRYLEEGFEGLRDRSRAAHSHPNSTPDGVVDLLVGSKNKHPTWGPKKLLVELSARYPGLALPATSTAGEILRRRGLTMPRRRSRAGVAALSHLGSQAEPNQTWATDFKGQFRTGDRRYCYPFTLSDGRSRFLLKIEAMLHPTGENVRRVMERAFREFGMPDAMRSDNGPPFAASGFTGLSSLSVWWLQLGIRLDRTDPGSPQQNGRHERLHRTLKEDVCRDPRANIHAQQAAFIEWRSMYNDERPHEALGMLRPTDVYVPSARPYPDRLDPPSYPNMKTRRIQSNGQACFDGWNIQLTTTLSGLEIGFLNVAEDTWELRFYDHPLGTLDSKSGVISNGRSDRKCAHGRVRVGGTIRPRPPTDCTPPRKTYDR